MRLPFSLFLAIKYLRPKRTFISVVTVISMLGVLLGVAVLLIVLSVMSGFDDMWREKILSFNAHLTITTWGGLEDEFDVRTEIEAIPDVVASAPFIQGLIFLQSGERVATPVLRGIMPELERRISRIPESAHMVTGSFDVGENEVVLGADLAGQLGVSVGDRILAYSPQHFGFRDELLLPEELTVKGIFRLGMFDFDMGYALTHLETARELYGLESGVHGLQVMTRDPYRALVVSRAVSTALGPIYRVQTWMEQNRQLFAALRVEKNMMFFLLIFITVVAAFGITNTLITVTVQKTHEIGVLKALGFGSGRIMRVFFWQGWIAGLLGTGAGLGFGWVVLRHRNRLMHWLSDRLSLELFPKELYHLTEIPARTSWGDVALISVSVLVICTLAGIVPAWRAARLDPARALRYE